MSGSLFWCAVPAWMLPRGLCPPGQLTPSLSCLLYHLIFNCSLDVTHPDTLLGHFSSPWGYPRKQKFVQATNGHGAPQKRNNMVHVLKELIVKGWRCAVQGVTTPQRNPQFWLSCIRPQGNHLRSFKLCPSQDLQRWSEPLPPRFGMGPARISKPFRWGTPAFLVFP